MLRRPDSSFGAVPRTKRRAGLGILALLVAVAATACTSEGPREPVRDLRYVGSSTVAIFLREAEERHPGFRFEIDSEPESGGGEAAILERRTDLGGPRGTRTSRSHRMASARL